MFPVFTAIISVLKGVVTVNQIDTIEAGLYILRGGTLIGSPKLRLTSKVSTAKRLTQVAICVV